MVLTLLPEEAGLAVLMAVWMICLPPGSLYVQGTLRLMLMLLYVALVALALNAFEVMRAAGGAVLAGFVSGMLIRFFLCQKKPGEAFRLAVIPMVKTCEGYFTAVMRPWIATTEDRDTLPDNRRLEALWKTLPRWVEHAGFDQRLQPGYRFFLARLLDIADVLFALHYLSKNQSDEKLPAFLQEEFDECVVAIQFLFSDIQAALSLQRRKKPTDDLMASFMALEKKIQQEMPPEIEWLEAASYWWKLADVVCCLEDLRWLLLRLAEALDPAAGMSQLASLSDSTPRESIDPRPTLPTSHHRANESGERGSPGQN